MSSTTDGSDLIGPESRSILNGLERVTSLLLDARSSRGALERIGLVLSDVLKAERWSIMLKTELDVIRISLAKGLPTEVVERTEVKLGEGISGRVAQDATPMLYRNVEYELGMTSGARYASPSAISVPIILRGNVLGVINLSEKRLAEGAVGDFNEADLTLAVIAANQAALIIEVLRQHGQEPEGRQRIPLSQTPGGDGQDVRVQASAFGLLSRVTDLMTVSGDLDQVLIAALNGACELLGATRGSVMLCDTSERRMRIRANIGMDPELAERICIEIGEGIAGRVLQSGEALLLTNAPQTRLGTRSEDSQSRHYRNHTALCVPLSIHRRVLGVLNLNDRRDRRDFSDNDLYIARVIANQAALAISAAQLLKESIEAAKMQHLMDVAQDIQANLLPTRPRIAGLDIDGCSEPCASAGGDYIDYFAGPAGRDGKTEQLFVACGDVSGHGVGAALIMATGRAFLRALLRQDRDLASVVFEMNNLIEADVPTGQFMTLFVGILDPLRGCLRYVSAGHDPALLCRKGGREVVETVSTGLPLGIFPDQAYFVSELAVAPGDVLLLSTDGIAEARNINEEFYGRARLHSDLLALSQQDATEILARIRTRVRDFAYPKALDDDMSLIAIRVLPPDST